MCVLDVGCEPSWYVSDLAGLVADYCLTWREPLLTFHFYDIITSIIGTSNCRTEFTNQFPFLTLDNVRVMVIVWRLRVNMIRTALCWIV